MSLIPQEIQQTLLNLLLLLILQHLQLRLLKIVLEATSSDQNTASLVPPSASDSVGNVHVSNDAPAHLPVGETIVTWTAQDEEGNLATSTQKITIVDTTAPDLFVPDDIIIDAISLQTPIDVGAAAAIDLAESSVTITNDAPFSFATWLSVSTKDRSSKLIVALVFKANNKSSLDV